MRQGADVYRQVHLNTAAPSTVLNELYGRLLRDMGEARSRIQARDPAGKGVAIDHAMQIITELTAALDFKVSESLCQRLDGLYNFVRKRLIEANAKMKAEPLADAERVITILQDAFQKAAVKMAGDSTPSL